MDSSGHENMHGPFLSTRFIPHQPGLRMFAHCLHGAKERFTEPKAKGTDVKPCRGPLRNFLELTSLAY